MLEGCNEINVFGYTDYTCDFEKCKVDSDCNASSQPLQGCYEVSHGHQTVWNCELSGQGKLEGGFYVSDALIKHLLIYFHFQIPVRFKESQFLLM